MHQALHISRITGLPAAIQQTARAALNGSLDDLNKVVIGMSNLPDAQAILLLPVFHHTLQTLVIPTANQLDDPGVTAVRSPVRKTLRMAFAVIRGVLKSGIGKSVPIPGAACRELWPPTAKWLWFLLTFHEHLRWLGGPSEELLCIDVALFAGSFVDDPDRDRRTTQFFASSPGFRFMMGKALLYVLKNDTSPFQTCLFILHFLTEYLDVGDHDNLEEFVDAAGGSFDQFAILLLDKINRIVSDSQPTGLSQNDITSFRFLLSMVVHIEMKTTSHAHRVATMGPLVAAFVPHGGARAFTALALALARSKFASDFQAGTRFVFEKCIMILSQLFTAPGGHMHLSEALECGLLAAVVSAAKSPFADAVHSQSSSLILHVLQPFTVYHSVLSKMTGALLDAAADERAPVFKSSQLFPLWSVLRQLAKERLDVLKYFRTRESEYKACDNDECGQMSHKRDFKRCGGCQSLYYCSAACQAHDWHHGGHAEHCTAYRASCFSASFFTVTGSRQLRRFVDEHTEFGTRDRSFLRALLHYEYCFHKVHQIHLEEIKFMHSRPDTPYFILFDYRLAFAQISVKAIAEADEIELGPNGHHNVARAERSGGRIQLHVMRLHDVPPAYFLIPLRTNTSWVHDGLRRIAAELPADQAVWDMEGIVQQIRTLVEHVLETH
ncbi:hypothetical protein DFH06DRAFT_1476 [Mycena polygramma]|nr:hypothetical protein DFH06DRAFT_1476 [Mycena polygramma]